MTNHRPLTVTRRALLATPIVLLARSPARLLASDHLAPAIPIPDTCAGRELQWILEQVAREAKGLTVRELERHLSDAYLAAVPAADLRRVIRGYVGPAGPLVPVRTEGGITEERANVLAQGPNGDLWRIRLGVSPVEPYRIDALFFEPVAAPELAKGSPANWAAFGERFRALAPRVSFAAAELTDAGPRWLLREHGEQPRAIASLFKVFVLGELMRQVGDGNADWDESLAIVDGFRSLPNGAFRWLASGTELPLRTYAEQMIGSSDNTATDHLIGRLGRAGVEATMTEMGHEHIERTLPLLLTREWFAMRMRLRDSQIERYLRADIDGRLRILTNTVDPLADTLSEAEPWPGPRFLDKVEWFAGAADVVRALDWIRRSSAEPALAPARDAMSLAPGARWHPARWKYVGYKGGYETGAMSDAWLLQRQDGRWFAFAAVINNTRREIDYTGLWRLHPAAEALLAAEP